MKTVLIALLAWLGTAVALFAANTEGPVVRINKDGLTLIRNRVNDRVVFKFSENLKRGVYDKARLLNYPHLPKQVGRGDTLAIVYMKDGPDYVITHIAIEKKANGEPVPPKPANWKPSLPPELQTWLTAWKHRHAALKGSKPPKKK